MVRQSKCAHFEDHLEKFQDFVATYNALTREHDECTEKENDYRQRIEEVEGLLVHSQQENTELNNQLKRKKGEVAELQKRFVDEFR